MYLRPGYPGGSVSGLLMILVIADKDCRWTTEIDMLEVKNNQIGVA
jgi:hypothetical protein